MSKVSESFVTYNKLTSQPNVAQGQATLSYQDDMKFASVHIEQWLLIMFVSWSLIGDAC